MESPKFYGRKAISNKYVFNFLQKKDLITIGSRFQIVGADPEKACLPIFSLVLGKQVV